MSGRPDRGMCGPLSELGEGQNVSVGIGEPRDAIAVLSRPHAVGVLLHAFVSGEHNAEGFEPADGLLMSVTRQPSTV